MSVTFNPKSLEFGAVAAGSAGPSSAADYIPIQDLPGVVMFWGGQNSPAGNITASIQGDPTHFSVRTVIALRAVVAHGVHFLEVGRSDGVTPLPVARGQAVAVQVQYDTKSATGTLSATLVIHGDTPAWAPDSLIPLTLSVIPVRTVRTVFGSPFVSISPGGQGTVPINVTNVTGPSTDVTYTLPQAWGPSTSIKGVPVESGLAMDEYTFHQVPAGGTQPGSLRFTLPRSTLPAGSYPFSIAMWAFDGVPPNNNNPVTPPLTLVVAPGQISVAFLNSNPIRLRPGDSAMLSVVVTVTMSAVDYIGINLVPVNLPAGVTMSSVSGILSDNPDALPDLPPHNVDASGSRTFNMAMNIDPSPTPGTFTLTIDWTASVQGTGSDVGGPPQTGSITTPFTITVLPQAVAFASGTLGPSTTTASATWVLNAQGFWNFSGSIHESGVIGHAYGFGMALDVKDANGVGLAVVHSGSVGPNLPLGHNDDSWSDTGFDQRIIDLWPAIVSAQSSAGLNVTTDAIHIFDAVLAALGVVAVAVLAVAGAGHVQCEKSPTVQRSEDGTGVDLVWKCYIK